MRRFAFIGLLSLALFGCLFVHAEGKLKDHDATPDMRRPGVKPPPTNQGPVEGAEASCTVNPYHLAEFANGEEFDFPNMVNYLTAPACYANSRQISQVAINSGIAFSTKPPFKLDGYARTIPRNDPEGGKQIDDLLARTVPGLLRENPMTSQELYPILGQLSVLSPTAARSTLGTMISQELIAGAGRLDQSPTKEIEDVTAADVARNVVKMGGNEGVIANELAAQVEDMALSAQADSLGKIFRSLGAAARFEQSLAPTFNVSAGALNRGVQKGKKTYDPAERARLLTAVFKAIRSSMTADGSLEPGSTELNEALGSLLGGSALSSTTLRKLWREATAILGQSASQTALADAVALSLTPQWVFLNAAERKLIIEAGQNYPQVSASAQSNYLIALSRLRGDLTKQKLSSRGYNKIREQYFEPLVAEMIEWESYLIDPRWLSETLRQGLVKDEIIEKKFPRFVLAYLDRWSKATRGVAADPRPEQWMSASGESMAVLLTLTQVHLPALNEWVKKYEK